MSKDNLPTPAAKGNPIVHSENGESFADSRDVAAFFEKAHKDVLKAIRDLHCSTKFTQRNFSPFKTNDLSGESTSHVRMTRDGFVFLAMGFTGARAAQWKEAYIEAFNAMEAQLRAIRPVANQFDMMRAVIDNMESQNQRLFTVEKAVESLGAHEDYMTIKAYAAVKGIKLKGSESADLGRLATSVSRQKKVKTGQQVDQTYGHVNTYHRDILDEVFQNR